MRTTSQWNLDWAFYADPQCRETLPAGTLPWQPVTLPHDWQIWHVKELYQDGTGWYRKVFSYTPGQRFCLYFEGVYMDSAIFVNGQPVMEWKYGYSSFQADLTDFLRPGENTLLVRCLLRHPNSRWYSGAGIYRNVWCIRYDDTHLVTDGLYISPRELAPGRWQVTVSAEAANALPGDCVEYTLLTRDGEPVTGVTAPWDEEISFPVENPILWDVAAPHFYHLTARLLRDGAALDEITQRCGFRTVEVSPDTGLWLNHRPLVLHGVCLHHDLGCLGAAFNRAAAKRQLEIMQDMGVNALRTTHNMPAPQVMDLADELGIVVVDEAFDMWLQSKTPYDYARFFPQWYQKDVASWVRRDRNHPCLLMWSIGNEIYDTHRDAREGYATTQALCREVARHDPRKNGLVTFGSNYMAWENTQHCAPLLDVVGYNYGESLYDQHHRKYPDWVIYGSETSSIVQSRGIYHFPLSQPLLADDDLQCSSLGNSRTCWSAKSHQACIASDELYPYHLGQFLWSGIDYIGEPTPYHTKNSYFGLVDTAGFPKDYFYAYQAGWHSWKDKPVLHLLPYWDFNPGQKIDISILSNLPQVELVVNGQSQGRVSLRGGSDIRASWQVPYAPGYIEAIGYDGQGRELARDRQDSFGDTAALRITANRTVVDNSGTDLVFCTITAVDSQGHPVRNAVDAVRVSTRGPLELVGLDNGNSADMDEYKTDCRQLFSGMLLAVVAGSGQPGVGTIQVSAPGLGQAAVEIQVQAARACIPILPKIAPRQDTPAVPVRRVTLEATSLCLTKEHPTAEITARCFPENAADKGLRWRVTDRQGITVTNVTVEELGQGRVRITGVGDGDVRIRCICGLVLSDLEVSVRGLGQLTLNPYEFVCAALFSDSQGDIGAGIEQGITTGPEGTSWVAFDQLDFGPAGAQELTIAIFEMSGIPTPIRFWKGIPYAPGSRMIGQRVYDKATQWNVYQDETYRLDEALTGRDVLGIELDSKIHIRGFRFRERSLAWETIPATGYASVYGDKFTLTENSVEGIGNNVSLVFRGLDFGETGFRGLAIRGRSKLENNTIHILFTSQGAQQRRMVEFAGCGDYQTREFPLEGVTGKQEVTFLFLPGCDFDFMEFRFLP